MIDKNLRAWSNEPSHVIVKMPGMEYGMDTETASKLLVDLDKAIEAALDSKESDFFKSLEKASLIAETPYGGINRQNRFFFGMLMREQADEMWISLSDLSAIECRNKNLTPALETKLKLYWAYKFLQSASESMRKTKLLNLVLCLVKRWVDKHE